MGKYSSDEDRRRSYRSGRDRNDERRRRSRSRSRSRSPERRRRRSRSRSRDVRWRRNRDTYERRSSKRRGNRRSSSKSRRGRSSERSSNSRSRSRRHGSRSTSYARNKSRHRSSSGSSTSSSSSVSSRSKSSSNRRKASSKRNIDRNDAGSQDTTSYIPSAETIAKINSDEFASEAFVSRSQAVNGSVNGSGTNSRNDDIFGSGRIPVTIPNVISRDGHQQSLEKDGGMIASRLHETEESKNQRWIRKLQSMREKKNMRN